AADNPATALGPSEKPRHLGRCPGLINEDQLGRIKPCPIVLPALASLRHIRPLLLGRAHAFFERDGLALKEAPVADDHAVLPQFIPKLFNRQIRLRLDALQDPTSKPCASACASGGRGFSFQSDAIRANATERFRAARIAFLRNTPSAQCESET